MARPIADVLGESPFRRVKLLQAEGALCDCDNEAAFLKSLKAPAGSVLRYSQIGRDLSHAVGNLAVVQAHVAFR